MLSKFKMLSLLQSNNSFYFVSKCVRSISQFRITLNDCMFRGPPRKIVDPEKCGKRDTGLVLGVYWNENVTGERAILTASAKKYNEENNNKLWDLLQLSPIPKLGETRVFFDIDKKYAFVAVAGLGSECLAFNKIEKLDENKEAIRIAAGVGAKALQALNPTHVHVESFGNAEAAAEGAQLAVWQYTAHKTPKLSDGMVLPPITLSLYDDCDQQGWMIGLTKAEAQNLARYLQEMPANLLNPTKFAKIAVDLLCELDINVHVKTKGWADAHDMGGFGSIGKSSIQPPLYVEIGYHGGPKDSRPIVLIGKGVTFDSGSLDIKTREELLYMKGDMAGAACVLSITRAAAKLKLPVNIRGILPLCEIMPNCRSPKHGDICTSNNGKSILIRLPSREGRLMMADSLVYARQYWPKFIVDIGTFSAELEHCLGNAACGCYTNSDNLFCYLELASSQTGDRIWRMPLWKFYADRVKDIDEADLANAGLRKFGDSPNCAAFLNEFICDSQWIHLDTHNIAYTKGRDFDYLPRGMTGRPTRTIIELIHQLLAGDQLNGPPPPTLRR